MRDDTSFAKASVLGEEEGYSDGWVHKVGEGEKTYAYWKAHRKARQDREQESAA